MTTRKRIHAGKTSEKNMVKDFIEALRSEPPGAEIRSGLSDIGRSIEKAVRAHQEDVELQMRQRGSVEICLKAMNDLPERIAESLRPTVECVRTSMAPQELFARLVGLAEDKVSAMLSRIRAIENRLDIIEGRVK